MKRTEICELTVLCLLRHGGDILLQNRVKNDWRGYALPGGHVEAGESIVDAVVREMREETGLTVLSPKLCGIKQFPIEGGRYLVFLFKAERFEGELHSSSEGAVEWVARDRVGEYPCVEDLETLLCVMEDDAQNEFQYTLEEEVWKVLLR